MPAWVLKSRYAARIRWSRRGSCGNAGCTDPECGCSFCGLPIGVPDDDPRWNDHLDYCDGCELCQDEVPIHLFRGEGKATEGAQFHTACFTKLMHFRTGCPTAQDDPSPPHQGHSHA